MFYRFRAIAQNQPNKLAIETETHSATFGELLKYVGNVDEVISQDKRPTILLALPGGPHFTAVQLSAFKNNAVVAPIPHKCTENEARSYLRLVRPDLIVVESIEATSPIIKALDEPTAILSVTDTDKYHEIHRVIEWRSLEKGIVPLSSYPTKLPDSVVMIQFTSGSTDTPKGILMSNENFLSNQDSNKEFLAGFEEKDVFCPIPQFHAMGGAVVLEYLLSGCAVHLSNAFFPGTDLRRMQKNKCSTVLAGPNYIKLLIKLGAFKKEYIPSLESVVLGTAPIDQSLVVEMRKYFPDLSICLRYGLSESVGTLNRLVLLPSETLKYPGLVGPPVIGVELDDNLLKPEQGDAREIRVKGGAVAIGQLIRRDQWETLTDQRGFLSTGDLGYLDAHGQIHLRGRLSTFIKSDGYRINPFEIEALLRQYDGINEAVVVGIPDPMSGQRVVACLENALDDTCVTVEALQSYCEENLSPYKIPKDFRFMTSVPRTRAGKPDRKKIREIVCTPTTSGNQKQEI